MLGFSAEIAQWVFDRGRLGGPKGLLAAVISASGAHEQLTKEELTAQIGIELKTALGELPSPLWSQVITEKRATFFLRAGARPAAKRLPQFQTWCSREITSQANIRGRWKPPYAAGSPRRRR